MAGFNVCLFVMGQTESGKSYTMTGEGSLKTGVVPMIIDYLFTRLQDGEFLKVKVCDKGPYQW